MTPEREAQSEIAECLRRFYGAPLNSEAYRLLLAEELIDHLKDKGFQITPYDPRQKP